jgi:hypothetical protein
MLSQTPQGMLNLNRLGGLAGTLDNFIAIWPDMRILPSWPSRPEAVRFSRMPSVMPGAANGVLTSRSCVKELRKSQSI